MRRFYVSWNPQAESPRYRHEDYPAAVREARRLAQTNPGQEFIVLCALTIARLRDPVEMTDLEGPMPAMAPVLTDDDIPF